MLTLAIVMLRRFFLALFIFYLCLAFARPPLQAAAEEGAAFYPGASISFDHLTIEDGLSQNTIHALLQDHRGYLWIGTANGLNRYDGYTFTRFKNDPNDPNSLSFNSVISLYEDTGGYLWIGTWGGGLNRYDPTTGKFTRYLPDSKNPASLSNSVVTSIVQDKKGRLWVGTLGGLELMDTATGSFTHYHARATDPASLSSDAISVIVPANDGTLWVGTGAYGSLGSGLNRFDPVTGKAEHILSSSVCLSSPNVSSIAVDPKGSLWIGYGGSGVAGGGLDYFNPISHGCLHYDKDTTFGQFPNNNITRLLFDHDGYLWITIWGGGLLRMDPTMQGEFSILRHDTDDPESLSSDSVSTLLQDRSGVLWVGTYDAGINKLNLENLQFHTFKNNPGKPSSLVSNQVSAFAETRDGNVWIGTSEAGLDRFDPSTGQFTHYNYIPSNPDSLSSNRIMSLYTDTDGTLWIGTINNGLDHYDPSTDKFKHFQHNSADSTSLIDDEVTNITRDNSGSLWVATMAGLSRLDPASTGFVNYTGLSGAPVSLMPDGGDMWIGTWGGGISRLSLALPGVLPPDKKRLVLFLTLLHDATNPNSLSDNSVWSIHRTSDGMFWFGTSDGLDRYDPKTGTFKVYDEKNGLHNASIRGILESPDGYLWITTADGLARFDPKTETFRTYDKSDGLQGNEFNTNAMFISPTTGEIYVGGTNGFTIFNPQTITSNTTPPSVVITDFSLFNEPYAFDSQGNTPIHLKYNQNYISIDFTALDFHAPAMNIYMYRLEGFDHDWVQAGTRHDANYTNLPPGDYTFQVKAANSDGTWSTTESSLHIQIIPPFWKRWQFQGGLIIVMISFVVAGFVWRLRATRENALILEKRIAERTEELNKANKLLSEKAAQDAVAAERTRLARELHDAVTQTLFSATLIAEVLPELWVKNITEGNRRLEELRQLTRGALAEMRTLLVELRPNALFEVPLPTLLKQLTEALSGRAPIIFQLQCCGARKLPGEVQVSLYRIAQEALNNVVKHATATQAVITLNLGDPVQMTITDNGTGFDTTTVTADRLGLKIMRERAEAIGAEFSIHSSPGEGTQVVVVWK